MDPRLSKLISDYQKSVIQAVEHLKSSGIPIPSSDKEWALNGIAKVGFLHGEISYRKHGYGCEVQLTSGAVDFDFGPSGEITGFDVWRLSMYCENNIQKYGFSSLEEIDQCFEASIKNGEVRKIENLYFRASNAG